MKVLLTGANGFVGSHILDVLVQRGLSVAALLRKSSDTAFIEHHLKPANPKVSLVYGSIEDPSSLPAAMEGVTHVIHCAGRTKACKPEEFYRTNQHGTRNVVDAVNARNGEIRKLLHISSLAVVGPGTPEKPASESSENKPISHYGKSKLAAEQEVTQQCKTDYAIVRPPAIYGPRDYGFFTLFQAVNKHLLPRTNSSQALSLVYVRDLAEAAVNVLMHPTAKRRIYFAASPEVVTARQMADYIASLLGTWTIPIPLPPLALLPLCLGQEFISKVTGKAKLLNLQKYAELRAPGWVCDSSRLKNEIGYTCGTGLRRGVADTLIWYQNHHWL